MDIDNSHPKVDLQSYRRRLRAIGPFHATQLTRDVLATINRLHISHVAPLRGQGDSIRLQLEESGPSVKGILF